MSMHKWKTAKEALREAKELLGMIGKPQQTTRKACGHLHKISVAAEIHYQETDGAKNYHQCEAFNRALSSVVRRNFETLAAAAIATLETEVFESGEKARGDITAMLAEIDAYECPEPSKEARGRTPLTDDEIRAARRSLGIPEGGY